MPGSSAGAFGGIPEIFEKFLELVCQFHQGSVLLSSSFC
jgi:hypothetical protein